MTEQEILNRLEELQKEKEALTTTTDVDNNQVEQPSTEGQGGVRSMDQVYQDRMAEGGDPRRPGVIGTAQDLIEGTGRNLYENAAPLVGISDTIIDTINLASADGGKYDIPKLPAYESNTTQAIRNISGLVIPSLGLRAKLLQAGAKAHAAGQAAPWLQKLGNSKSFEYFAKFGADVGTGIGVDYVAEQNQKDDNLLGVLKNYWPRTYQWIPDSIATTVDDSPGEKRMKNVNEGAIFNVLSSIIEGAAYILKGGRSIKRTAQFIPASEKGNKNINDLVKDEFSGAFDDVTDNPIEAKVLEGYARKEKELNLINEFYLRTDQPPVDWGKLNETDTLKRSKDPDGILGAQPDSYQIQNNLDSSYGRIGNLVHEATRMEGIQLENLSNRTLVAELSQQLKEGGNYSKRLKSNKLISAKMMDDAGKKLVATILDPRVDANDIIGILDEFKRSIEGSAIRIVGKKGISGAIKGLKNQLADLDVQKARAYLLTSEAGQIADFSEGARLMEDNSSVLRTVDAMADRLEVLQVEKGLANFEASSMLSNMNDWKKAIDTGDKEVINATADTILQSSSAKLTEIIPDAKRWSETLKNVARENPQFLRPLLLANEFTDGNVDTLYKLHRDAANRLGVFSKAIYDGNPDVPSIVNKAWWSNIFNSTLSAAATPAKAAVGNLTGLLGKGLATVSGAVLEGDVTSAKKAMVAHFALDDTLQKATEHMRLVFRKASTNPKEVSYVMRGDLAIQEEKSLNMLRAYADASDANEEYGASMLLGIYEDLDALSMDPVLRFGGNSMTAFDGFTKSVMANTEAKYIALNKLAQSGEEITEAGFKKAYKEVYDTFFDSNGMIKNSSIDTATSEIALNADSPVVDGMNKFIKRFPAARTFIRFPRTTANVIDTFTKWSPAGALSSDYQKMWGPLGRKSLNSFSMDEIQEILQSKGKPIDEFALENFNMIRYEVKGKAAIGSLMTTLAFFAGVNDRCTGNGHYNKAIQTQRIKSGWKAKSCKMPGTNKVVSYEWMGPIGDWLSLTLDVVDNADTLGVTAMEDLREKLAFVLGSAFTNRSVMAQLEPMYDVLQGNGAAATRFLASFTNDMVPLGGARNELGKILYPQLRQIRSDLDDHLRNRNAWLDAVDPSRSLTSVVDPIDGKEIGKEDNWFIRVWNRGPIKIHSQPSKERQFLIDIEFNSSPAMRMSQRGVVLENHEITAINSKMGEQGVYKQKINEIMKDANRLSYTDPNGKVHKGFQNILKAQRRGLISSEILNHTKYANIFSRLSQAYAASKRLAENNLDEPMRSIIREREYAQVNSEFNQKAGNLHQLYEDAGLNETLNIAK